MCVFFFKQKTAYEMRISDWSSDGALPIYCAGPFLGTATPLIEAALRAGVHYLDVTAEQAVAAATFERFDAAALRAGVVVAPAMAFYGGLADALATEIGRASCREGSVSSVVLPVVTVSLKKKQKHKK